MLEVCDLEKSYGHHPVLRKISFSAKPGTCVGIVPEQGNQMGEGFYLIARKL